MFKRFVFIATILITLYTSNVVLQRDPDSTLLWDDMDLGKMCEYVERVFPEEEIDNVEFVWRVANFDGVKRPYWVIQIREE